MLQALDAPPDFPIGGRTLREVLIDGVSLAPAPDMLFQLFSYITGGERRKKAQALAAGEDPDGDAATLDVLAAIEKFSGVRPDPEAFIEALDPLQPRLYSISSSPKVHKGRVALTVDAVRYDIGKRKRLGVASTFLADRVEPGDQLRVYVQKAHAFGLPADPQRADHHGRPRHRRRAVPRLPARAHGDQGAGPQLAVLRPPAARLRFLLRGRVRRHEGRGRADAAVARLVARRRREILRAGPHAQVGRELWSWIADGAHVYVCGDAKRMAKDVERALIDIVAPHGARSTNEAVAFVAELKKAGRYQTDVY